MPQMRNPWDDEDLKDPRDSDLVDPLPSGDANEAQDPNAEPSLPPSGGGGAGDEAPASPARRTRKAPAPAKKTRRRRSE